MLAVAAVTALWVGILVYLIPVTPSPVGGAESGCERVLAQWILPPPSDAELSPRRRDPFNVSWCVSYMDLLWPQKAAVLAMEPTSEDDPGTYPQPSLMPGFVRKSVALLL